MPADVDFYPSVKSFSLDSLPVSPVLSALLASSFSCSGSLIKEVWHFIFTYIWFFALHFLFYSLEGDCQCLSGGNSHILLSVFTILPDIGSTRVISYHQQCWQLLFGQLHSFIIKGCSGLQFPTMSYTSTLNFEAKKKLWISLIYSISVGLLYTSVQHECIPATTFEKGSHHPFIQT